MYPICVINVFIQFCSQDKHFCLTEFCSTLFDTSSAGHIPCPYPYESTTCPCLERGQSISRPRLSNVLKVHFNIILRSTPVSSKWSLRIPYQNTSYVLIATILCGTCPSMSLVLVWSPEYLVRSTGHAKIWTQPQASLSLNRNFCIFYVNSALESFTNSAL